MDSRWVVAYSGICLVLAVLTAALLLRPRLTRGVRPPTRQELESLELAQRIELLNGTRQANAHIATSVSVAAGLLFTMGTLYYTALTWETAQQGQITERYSRAVGDLGSERAEVRQGAIYALARLAADSPADRETIANVVDSYIRAHIRAELRPRLPADAYPRPSVDVLAALTVARSLRSRPEKDLIDLTYLDARGVNVKDADMRRSDLSHAVFVRSFLVGANLSASRLSGSDFTLVDTWLESDVHCVAAADLSGVDARRSPEARTDFHEAHLRCAKLHRADLSDAFLGQANLSFADLSGARLIDADLTRADLRCADLSAADLTGADLDGADLRGANLTNVKLPPPEDRGSAQVTGAPWSPTSRLELVDMHAKVAEMCRAS